MGSISRRCYFYSIATFIYLFFLFSTMASQRQDRAWLGFLYRIVWLFLILLYRQIEKEEAILFFLLLHFPTTNASSVGGSFPFCRDDGRRFFLSFFLLTWNSVTGCRLLMTPTNRKGSEKATKRMGKKMKRESKAVRVSIWLRFVWIHVI